MSIFHCSDDALEGFRPLTLVRLTAGDDGVELEVSSGTLSHWPTSRLPSATSRLLRRCPDLAGRETEWALRSGVPLVCAIAFIAEVVAGRTQGRWAVCEKPGERGVYVIAAPLPPARAAPALLDAIEAIEGVLPLHLKGVAGLEVVSGPPAVAKDHDGGARPAAVAVLEST